MTSAFDLVRAEQMLIGYSARWYAAPLEVLAVEAEFDAPLLNPDTGAESRTFRLGGKIDAIVRHTNTGRIAIVEHKTSSEDCSPGSLYWRRCIMSGQLSNYFVGARALGYAIDDCIFDVLVKPAQRPLKATPEESRKYTKAGSLYAGQHADDETPDMYRARVCEAIEESPDKYFVRRIVVRLQDEEREAAYDVWQSAAAIRECRNAGRFPRNPDACQQYGSICTYFPVCVGEDDITNSLKFRKTENVHEELSGTTASLPLLTSSQLSAARRCSRLHHYRYDLGVRAVEDDENLRFGTLVHRGLEGYWLGLKDHLTELECIARGLNMMREPVKTTPVQFELREAVSL